MALKEQRKEIYLVPHSVDPSRKRWFWVCTIGTIGFAVIGWFYFFSQQMRGLTEAFPETADSFLFLKEAAVSMKDSGQETISEAQKDLAPETEAVLTQIQATTEQAILIGTIIDELENRVANPETENKEIPLDDTITEQPQ